MGRKHLYILASVLTLIGAGIFLYKAFVLGFPIVPAEVTETWRIEARVQFQARGGAVRATLHVPQNEPGLAVVTQNFVLPNYGLTTSRVGPNRTATFSTRRGSGEQVVYYRAVVHRSGKPEPPPEAPEPQRRRPAYRDADLTAARSIVRSALRNSADVETLVKLIFRQLRESKPGDEASLLLNASPTTLRIATVGVNLLLLADVPARTVHGLALTPDRRNAQFSHWIEVYDDRRWRPYDPAQNHFVVPEGHMAWWRGPARFVRVSGAQDVETLLSVRRAFEFTLQTVLARGRNVENALLEYSVFGLPLQTQAVYQLLLTVPFGIFLLVVLRNVVGIRTFGTFMPVLIGLAFRQTELLWGIILFSIVLAAGLGVRFYLEQLKLLLVPRIATVVTVVILIMTLISIVSHKLEIERGLSVALFPIVILSMTIERMTIVWDERGPREAFTQAGGSLLVAVLAYLVMNFPLVRHIAFVFPETLLIVLAAILLLGRYTGYRLVDLPRFRVLAR